MDWGYSVADIDHERFFVNDPYCGTERICRIGLTHLTLSCDKLKPLKTRTRSDEERCALGNREDSSDNET